MHIQIVNHDNVQEWFLMEFKGHFEPPTSIKELNNCKIGEIVWHGPNKCDLSMGPKSITGTVIQLSEPFQVLRKRDGVLTVVAVINRQISFTTEPRLELI